MLELLSRSREGFSIKAVVMYVKVNCAYSESHYSEIMIAVFSPNLSRLCLSLLKRAILLLIPPFFSFTACCQERKLVRQKQGCGVIPSTMLSSQGGGGVKSRELKVSTAVNKWFDQP